jgi:hypothetical protein
MAIDPSAYNIDPLSRAIPGQSLTATPGQAPYEKPPMTSSVQKALQGVLKGMHEPVQRESLLRLLETGLSAETIASGLVMKSFADGMITPDMAELMKPVLVLAIMGIAYDEGVEDVKVLNTPAPVPISYDMVSDLVDKISDGDDSDMQEDEAMMPESEEMPMMDTMSEGGEEGFINRGEEPSAGFIDRPPEDMMMNEEQI